MNNARYNQIRILHDLCRLCWFLSKHAIAEADHATDPAARTVFEKIEKDLTHHIAQLEAMVCGK